MKPLVGLLCATLAFVFASSVRAAGDYQRTVNYQSDMVLRCPDKNKPTVKVLQQHADVWNTGKESVDLRLNRRIFARVQRFFPECSVLVANLESYMQEAEAQMFPQKKAEEQAWVEAVIQETIPRCNLAECEKALAEWEHAFQQSKSWFQEYHDYDSICNFYKQLETDHPDIVAYIDSIGETIQGRKMPAVHITATKSPNRKKFYMQCQIHAREWITGSVCMYIANYLAKNYKHEKRVTDLLDNLEFVLIPIVNPDGMVYTWTKDRLWRKNRNKSPKAACYGVDINRNFKLGYVHKDPATSSCAEDFGGTGPLSEKETQHITNYFRVNAPIIGSIDWHSYGQLLLRPYGYTNQTSPDNTFLTQMSNEMVREIYKVHRQKYTAEASQDLYPCYGIAADWLYSNDAARTNKGYRSASICIELRDKTGHYGFVLPADQILDTAEEVLPGFLYYAESMLKHPLVYNEYTANLEPKFDEKVNYRPRHG